jgi:hypothetical protein
VNQWEHQRHDSVLHENDPRRAPFSQLLVELHERYRRPLFVAETSSSGDDRSRWLSGIYSECLRAMRAGVDLHGICLYPILGMDDWHSGEYRAMGLWDCDRDGRRAPHQPLMETLRTLQARMAYSPSPIPHRRPAERVFAGIA